LTIKSCLLLLLMGAYCYAPQGVSSPLALGIGFGCTIKAGNVFCWGENHGGQLDDGAGVNRSGATLALGLSGNSVAVTAGLYHACALSAAGGVKCWGDNANGQLGDGTNNQNAPPVTPVGLDNGVQAISAGGYHTCALTNAGAVLCWGYNGEGELGDGTTNDHPNPTQVSGLESGVKAISTGMYGSCALTTSGAVFCWGNNVYGSVGDGIQTWDRRTLPSQVYGLRSGTSAITSGDYHSCALSAAGGVICWGNNDSGQLGNADLNAQHKYAAFAPVQVDGFADPQTEITAGAEHTCSISLTGAARCWGSNAQGELGGLGQQFVAFVPPTLVSRLSSQVSYLAAGSQGTCALVTTGAVLCWGAMGFTVEGFTYPKIVLPIVVQGLGYSRKTYWHPH
jgi:alpha-tubulin suppressor-like RCC1 family protein